MRNEEMTFPSRVVRQVGGPKSAPAWLTYVVVYLFVKVELLFLTDADDRAALVEQIPAGIAWVANNGATILAAVGVGITVWQLIIKQRPHTERSTD